MCTSDKGKQTNKQTRGGMCGGADARGSMVLCYLQSPLHNVSEYMGGLQRCLEKHGVQYTRSYSDKNPAANGGNVLRTHYVDPNIGVLSDHHAIILQAGHSNSIVPNLSNNKLNWKHADEEEFKCTLKELIEDNSLEYHTIVSESLNSEKESAMPDELDRAMEFIQTLLKDTAKKTIPEQRICSNSKPWWTPELSKAYKDL